MKKLWITLLALLAPAPATLGQNLPVVPPGYGVEVYAVFGIRPGGISFDAGDNLYVGNFALVGQEALPVSVLRVLAVDRIVGPFGDPVDDPDVVIVDIEGRVGTAGSVLAAGSILNTSPTRGHITEITPDGLSTARLVDGGCLANAQGMAFDSQGRLFVANADRQDVCLIQNRLALPFIGNTGGRIESIAVDPQDNLYVSPNGVARKYSPSGALLDPAVATGNVLGYGSSGVFQGLLLDRSGNLLSVDPGTKIETSLIMGAGARFIAFNSQGELFLSQFSEQRVLRVYPTCTDGDGDGYGFPGNSSCAAGAEEDCDDLDASVSPSASELCDGTDNDCDGVIPSPEADLDQDGFRGCENDCDDADPGIHPQSLELPGNDVDENCDGSLGACDPTAFWRNHGQFVRCVAHECSLLVDAGELTEEACDGLVTSAAQSDVGKQNP